MIHALTRSSAALAAMLLLSCGGDSPGPDATYTITLRYCSGTITTSCVPADEMEFPAADREIFEAQADRIKQMITAGLVPVNVRGINCGSGADAVRIDETVHGLLILVSIRDDLGPGILAQSGPCIVRSRSRLPLVSVMRFPSTTLGSGQLDQVVLHEMFHTLGFGTVWEDVRPLANVTNDPAFTGPQALTAARTFNEAPPDWTTIPVEDQHGPGTALSHWRDTVFQNELMTGIVTAGDNPLSAMSIASLADLGYTIDPLLTERETYTIPTSPTLRSLAPADAISLEGDVILDPPAVADEP